MLNLANLDQVGLVVTLPWFTLLVVLLECFTCSTYLQLFLQFFFLSSTRRKQIGHAFLDTDIDRFDVNPFFVQSRRGSLSRVDTLVWFEFLMLKIYVTNIYFLVERD